VTGKKSGSGTICGFRNTEHCSARTKVYAGGAMLRAPFKPYRYQKSAKFAQPAATPGFNSQCPRAGQMKLTQPTLASTQPVTRAYPEFSASSEMGVRCGRHSSQIHYRPTLDSGANGRDCTTPKSKNSSESTAYGIADVLSLRPLSFMSRITPSDFF